MAGLDIQGLGVNFSPLFIPARAFCFGFFTSPNRMRILVPMAGMGKRLRPHTLVTPKPLFPIAGKPIVQRLVEDIAKLYEGKIEEVAFIIGQFGPAVEAQLKQVGEQLGARVSLYYQQEPLGTAHAIHCAAASMEGELIIAFADTLFRADFKLDRSADGVIWVSRIDDPRNFGVVTLDAQGYINGMVEKPETPVSDLAIIGIYYIKNGPQLREEIEYLIKNNIRYKGEYQLTDALENLREKGAKFGAGRVNTWMDCGNKDNVLDTNQKMLGFLTGNAELKGTFTAEQSVVIEPCYIGEGAMIRNSIVGPYASVGRGAMVSGSVISNAILFDKSRAENVCLKDTIVGHEAQVVRTPEAINLGDFSIG